MPEFSTSGDAGIARTAAEFRALRQIRHPKVRAAADLFTQDQADAAEIILSRYLQKNPEDASALNLMGEVAFKMQQNTKAEAHLERCVELAPGFALARFNYARTLYELNKLPFALAQLDELLKLDQHNFLALDLKSVVLAVMGKHQDAMLCRRQIVDDHPDASEAWIKYASLLRSLAERDQCVAALRKAIVLDPASGHAYWALADLKTFEFSEAEIGAMQEQLVRTELSRESRIYIHFALGKAYSTRKEFAKSFDNYARGNALKRIGIDYDPDNLTSHIARSRAELTTEFFRDRRDSGFNSREPIFVIGMQRAGSTLVEQILASHSKIEATGELPDISLLVAQIGEQIAREHDRLYPEALSKIDPAEFKRWGKQYLASTQFRRTLGRPYFVDKMPYNFMHAGLLRLILPEAKIIDVRRHPLGCCFSNFSMYFEVGPLFAYRMNELGRAYSDYVALMAHMDIVQPGSIHRVIYESLIDNPEDEIRRLLIYLDLPFEESCLRFHESSRSLSSISAEQVRKPISREASHYWRNYEPWLGPLKAALGPVLDAYPGVPAI